MPRPTPAVAALASIGLLLSGCAMGRSDAILLNSQVRYNPLPANHTVLLTTTELNQAYVEVGFIHVSGATRQGYEGLNEKLREKAREMGCDAVLFIRYGTENSFSIIPFFVAVPYDVLFAEGTAVRTR